MKFSIEHEFRGAAAEVGRLMTHEKIGEIMAREMTTILGIEVLERHVDGDKVTRKVHYKPKPLIEKVGPMKVEPRWMEWIESSTFDCAKGQGRLDNVPTTRKIAKLMINSGDLSIKDLGGGKCRRVLSGELKVKVFMLGSIAEKIIYKQAKVILDEEATVIQGLIDSGELSD